MPVPTVPGYRVRKARLHDVRENDVLLIDGAVSTVTATGLESTGSGYVYTAHCAGGPISGPGDRLLWKLQANPNVGDGATQQVGSDAYPLTVIAVSKSGATIKVQRDKVKHISGTFQGNDYKADYEPDPEGAVLTARWSNVLGCYRTPGGTRIYATGNRRYYQDPSF